MVSELQHEGIFYAGMGAITHGLQTKGGGEQAPCIALMEAMGLRKQSRNTAHVRAQAPISMGVSGSCNWQFLRRGQDGGKAFENLSHLLPRAAVSP